MKLVTLLALPVVLLSNPAAAQSSPLDAAMTRYQETQRVLGANDACQIFAQHEIVTAERIVADLRRPLMREVGEEKLKTLDVREDGREQFEGCKTRDEAPEIWAQVDEVVKYAAAASLAPSYMKSDPGVCSWTPTLKMSRDGWQLLADSLLSHTPSEDQDELINLGKQMASAIDKECTDEASLGLSNGFRVAVANAGITQQVLHDLKEARPELDFPVNPHKLGTGPAKPDDWTWTARSRAFYQKSFYEYVGVTGFRTLETTHAAASLRLASGAAFRNNGVLYFSRAGHFEARMTSDIAEVVIVSVDNATEYPLARTNSGATIDFFGETKALFRMSVETRDLMFRNHDEDADFFIYYRPKPDSNLAAFKGAVSDDPGKMNLGDVLKAYKWAIAPSAMHLR